MRNSAYDRNPIDDDAVAAADQQLPNLGTIEIKIYRVEVIGRTDRNFSEPKISNGSVIHERSKKMSMHNVTYAPYLLSSHADLEIAFRLHGEGRRVPKTKGFKSRNLDDDPCVSFIFTYRPRGVFTQ